MKRLSLIMIVFLSISVGYAQVDNYCLQLPASGYVNAGTVSKLNEATNYTVQFWMNPTTWTANSAVFSRGTGSEQFAVRLGTTQGNMILCVGSQTVAFSSAQITTKTWAQVTIRYTSGTVTVYVNNEQVLSSTATLTIPTSTAVLCIGSDYAGYIDEFRLWTTSVDDGYLLWRNTINKYHPNWDDLVLYYKFDQNLCTDNVVDYKFAHHGTFQNGAVRSLVTDNTAFKYRVQAAYTDFSRFADRAIDKEKYLLSNDVVVLGVTCDSDGNVSIPYLVNQGTVTNGEYLASCNGRSGVLNLNGTGAGMNVGKDALTLDDAEMFSFQTWIYMDTWQNGAYLFRKESDDSHGFSIRFGNTDTLILRINGSEYQKRLPKALREDAALGTWWHFAVATQSVNALDDKKVFMFFFNGTASYASVAPDTRITTFVPDVTETDAIVGENFNGKLDETAIWRTALTTAQVQSYMSALPMPGFNTVVTAGEVMHKMDSYWAYDNSENVGYDSYSHKHFMSIMRSAYDGYRGYTLRMSVKGPDGWENIIANDTKRTTLAQGIADAVGDYDGIDLDFEWCYGEPCFTNFGKLIDAVGALVPENKKYTVSPHYVSYKIPTQYHSSVDYFYFQIYGPQPYIFTWNTYTDAYTRFTNYGYDNDKIVMSYATTTSKYTKTNNINAPTYGAAIGVCNGLLDGDYTPDKNVALDSDGNYRFFTGVNQTRNRSEYCHEKDLAGIMYWDMGNDVATSHQYSLPKHANYAIASNVDTLVTTVEPDITALKPVMDTKQIIVVYPNPTHSELSMVLDNQLWVDAADIYNTCGQLMYSNTSLGYMRSINVSELPDGYYILQVNVANGKHYTASFMKQ